MTTPEPAAPPSRVSRLAAPGVIALLAAAALVAYANTLGAPFVLDDAGSILENPTIHRLWPLWTALTPPSGGATVSGRPLVNLSLALNQALSGDAVWSYHAFNLLIHVMAACALFGLVRRAVELPRLRERFGRDGVPLAASIAGVWLLHPLQTESVTYVSQRAESLAALFCLLTLYGFVRSRTSAARRGVLAWRAVSWLACLAGMATKETMAAAPVLALACDLVLTDATGWREAWAEVWRERRGYHLALASTWLLLDWLVLGTGGRGGTVGWQSGLSPLVYLETQALAVAVYLKLCVWPHPLVFDYGLRVVRGLGEVWPQAVLVAGLLAATVTTLWRRRPVGLAGLCFFAILAPSSSFVPIGSETMAEHRMYLPLAAVLASVILCGYVWLGRRSLLLWPVVAAALGWTTHLRNETYASELGLWRDTVAKVPNNGRARYNLGIVYTRLGRYEEAVEQDRAALARDEGWAAAEEAPALRNKLGFDLAALGRHAEAVVQFEQALRERPAYAAAHFNLARSLARMDRLAESIREYDEALRLNPGDAGVEAELADVLLRAGRPAEALAHRREAVRLAPRWAAGWSALAYAQLMNGETDAAMASYRAALTLEPRDAATLTGLGYALISSGRPEEAVAPCREAVKERPDYADARNILGIALAQSGRPAEAVPCFTEALRLAPGAADVHANLANALVALGREDEAMKQAGEAVRLDPGYAPAHRVLAEALRRKGRAAEAAEQLAVASRLETEGGEAGAAAAPSLSP